VSSKKQTTPSCEVVVVGATTGTMQLDAIVDDALHLRRIIIQLTAT
jgi:hypothetical protein